MSRRDATQPQSKMPGYVQGNVAAQIIGGTPKHLAAAVEAGLIGTWGLPGARRLYSREDCERVRDQAYRPATSAPVYGASRG